MFRAGLSASSTSKEKESGVLSHLRRSSSSFMAASPSLPGEDVEDASAPAPAAAAITAESPRRRIASSTITSASNTPPSKAIKRTPTHRLRNRSFAPVSPTKSAMSKPVITPATAALAASDSQSSLTDTSSTADTSTKSESVDLSTSSSDRQNVVVCVRVRPGGDEDDLSTLWSFDQQRGRIVPTEAHPSLARRAGSSAPATGAAAGNTSVSSLFDSSTAEDSTSASYEFCFDSVVLPSDTTDSLYARNIAPIVRSTLDGFNGTVFAYGQTGSGKTHTMSGSEAEPGVIPRAVQEVFDCIAQDPTRQFLLRVSYLEIYNESLRDLLSPLPSSELVVSRPSSPTKGGTTHIPASASASLRIVELEKGRVSITGLREELVTDPQGVMDLLEKGQANRHVGATDWNERSSRSHCVFTITVESCAKDAAAEAGKEVRVSQLNLIDLAGSERAASSADRRKEGAFINKSLLTLGTVIAKLTERSSDTDASHIPYRDSKLTRLLQNSLGGNARVAVLCTLSPLAEHAVESLSTLKFGKRCKMVVTTAKRGTVMDDKALLDKYRRELNQLRARLEAGPSTPVQADSERSSPRQTDEERDALERRKEEVQRDVETMRLQKDSLRGQIEHLTRLILTSNSVVAERNGSPPVSTERSDVAASVTPRRGPRLSDMGVRSVRGSEKSAFLGSVHEGDASSTSGSVAAPTSFTASKPFAMEAELAALRRDLAAALKARRADAEAFRNEMMGVQARLEAEKQELEDELEVAHEAFTKVKQERGEALERAEEMDEAREEAVRRVRELEEQTGLLKLIGKSRESREGVSEEEIASRIAKVEEGMKDRLLEVKEEAARKEKAWVKEREDLQSRLNTAESERQKRDADLVELRRTTQEEAAKAAARPLPIPQAPSTPATEAHDWKSTLTEREATIARLEAELAAAHSRAATASSSSHARVDAQSATTAAHMETVVELQSTVDEQKQAIRKLEQDLVAEQQRAAAAPAARAKPLPVPSKTPTNHSPASPSKLRESTVWGSERGSAPSTPTRDPAGFRGGSMREYRRYSPSVGGVDDVFSPSAGSSWDATTSPGPPITSATIAAALKGEREEIARLNTVIGTQRSIIADLERSVADWKRKIGVQNDLIRQLDEAGGLGGAQSLENLTGLGVSYARTPPPQTGGLNEISLNASSAALSSSPSRSGDLRTQRSSAPPANGPTSPSSPSKYYGAHTYNRPLSGAPTSPTKGGAAWQTPLPGSGSPRPLPLPGSEGHGPQRRTPRKTIESEMRMLLRRGAGGGSVRDTRDRLLDEVAGGERGTRRSREREGRNWD